MQKSISGVLVLLLLSFTGCQPESGGNTVRVNNNSNSAPAINTNANSNNSVADSSASILETREPEQYQALVKLTLEASSTNGAPAKLPAISANVARRDSDRWMEFNLPSNEKVVYLDKSGTTYVILPNRKQYALLDKDSLGLDVRQLMMPEQIINQVKAVKGVERVGEENIGGRIAIKYRYGATTNTGTNAGQVSTESFFLVDKETGLPLRSETVSQSNNGNVRGFQGLRIVTEMLNIKTEAPMDIFAVPTDFAKIDAAQIKAQTDLIFNLVGAMLSNTLRPANSNGNVNSIPDANANRGR